MARPHPLGIESHPDWEGCRQAYYDLSVEHSAREEAEAAELANDNDAPNAAEREAFPGRAIVWGAIWCLVIAIVLTGALV